MNSPQHQATALRWATIRDSLTRPYPVSISMVALLALVPFYLFIADFQPSRTRHAPAIALDALLPLQPAWSLVYGALYLFLILLPVFVLQQHEHIHRTVRAYLLVWLTAYACFLVYPTVAPRPASVTGEGFAWWGLRFLYAADPPYNCFPSLHVAHSFVSALTCSRIHRGVGLMATFAASLVALSTLFSKQHYVIDVVAGVALAVVAYAVFLRGVSRASIPEPERRLAPVLAVVTLGLVTVGFAGSWMAYRLWRMS